MLNDVINQRVKTWYVTMKEGLLKAHRGNPLQQLHYKKDANFPLLHSAWPPCYQDQETTEPSRFSLKLTFCSVSPKNHPQLKMGEEFKMHIGSDEYSNQISNPTQPDVTYNTSREEKCLGL
uniref:Putative ovule protein n=1 Tax=Solanum chacoense TaxID=4108 RepID=A0A0V0H0M3_SOLCH